VADFDIDLREFDAFHRELEDLQEHFPKEAKRLMLRSGNHARKIFAKKARQMVRKKTGNYHRSIKRGRVWTDESTDEYKVRVYSRAPHAHLLEYGHRLVGHEPDKKELGFVRGFHVFDKAAKEVNAEWNGILEKEFDKIMSKL